MKSDNESTMECPACSYGSEIAPCDACGGTGRCRKCRRFLGVLTHKCRDCRETNRESRCSICTLGGIRGVSGCSICGGLRRVSTTRELLFEAKRTAEATFFVRGGLNDPPRFSAAIWQIARGNLGTVNRIVGEFDAARGLHVVVIEGSDDDVALFGLGWGSSYRNSLYLAAVIHDAFEGVASFKAIDKWITRVPHLSEWTLDREACALLREP